MIEPSSSEMPESVHEQAAHWFARLRANDISPAESAAFQAWYRGTASHRRAYHEIEAFWNDADFKQALGEAAISSPLTAKPQRQTNFRRLAARTLAVAATIGLLAGVCLPHSSCWRSDFCSATGEIKTLQLADGSSVTLNSASAIDVDFSSGLRQIRLVQGEAFFEVKRDAEHPFQVAGRYGSVKVLGTRFVVREDENSDFVGVVSGVVEVSRAQQQAAILRANDGISIDAERASDIRRINACNATAWLNGAVLLDNAPLAEVVSEIGRYRQGSLLIRDPALAQLNVSGRFDINDTDRALESLQQTLPISVQRLTPWLVIIGR